MSDNSLKSRAINGIKWKFAEKVGMQLMQFVIQIVLARLLMPEDYGLIGLLTIFINISDVFILQGFTTALIQKQNADEVDFSSVFFANMIMSFIIYIVLFALAPTVAWFYNDTRLTAIMRVLSLNVLFGAFCAVHNAIMQKNIDFKKSFMRNQANIFTQGIVGIALAYAGTGVWAFVFSKLTGTLVGAIVICIAVKWKPQKVFSAERIKGLFSYSSRILGTNLLNTVFNNIHSLIIGKFFVKADLGFYQRGQQMPQVIMTAIDGSLNETLYPTLSAIQNDMTRLKRVLRRSMKTSMFLVLPLLLGMMAVAEPIIQILLTDKWLPCVPYMKLSCIICAFWPLSARGHALNAIGRSNITFKLSLISRAMMLLFIFVCLPFGIYSIMLGTIASSFICMWITSYFVRKYIGYTYKEFIMDLFPAVALSLVMYVIVCFIGTFDITVYLKLAIQIAIGATVYICGAYILKLDSFKYILNMLKKGF